METELAGSSVPFGARALELSLFKEVITPPLEWVA